MELPANLEPVAAWSEIRAQLRRTVGESTYDIWIAPLEAKSLEQGVLLLEAPAATQRWVAKRFGRIVESSAKAVLGNDVRVTIGGVGDQTTERARERGIELGRGGLNPRYTFDQFIIGDGNRLAHAAALAVSELPGQAYNPLFLHAPPGLGKTHLLHAIGNYLAAFGSAAGVRYATAEVFTNHFLSALGSRSLDRFKRAYRDVDVLLIDDIQFLAGKAKTEEEFFHTFNALYETNCQLVLTCDRLPRELMAIEERLRERFEWGLVADIRPPDFATRVAILRKRAMLDSVPLTDPRALEAIAERVTDNVRALEGALIRVVAYHSLTGRTIDLPLTKAVLDGMYAQPPTQLLTVDDVQAIVASHYQLTVTELVSISRVARITWPRQVAIYLARALTDASLQTIGDSFGGRNHATVLHACKRVAECLTSDQHLGVEVDQLRRSLITQQSDRSC